MSRRKQRSAFDQVSEFDKRRIVAYRDCGLSFREIGSRLSGLSARRPLLGIPLTQNHRRLHRQSCDERRMRAAEFNEVVFTDELRICLQHHDGQIRVWGHRGERMMNSCVMHRHTGPAPGIMAWGGIGYHSRTPLGLATAIFQQDNARPHVARIVQRFFVNHQIELRP
ncbi:transposable element Tcb1 transposase [Trichonephila clavipes]|nr:transposable element Tcb1 transposase [Trichonephila clavipes]